MAEAGLAEGAPAEAVLAERIGSVVVWTMNRPDNDNRLDEEMLDALLARTSEVRTDGGVRAVVLTGAGANFSLGGAMTEFEEALTGGEDGARAYCRARTDVLAAVVVNLYELDCPVVAAVNGQAAGAGFSLALACDLRLAEPRTRFNIAYGALGASTDGGMSWFLPRLLGPAKALELLLEQPVVRAPRAVQDGLVRSVVDSAGELVPEAVRTAQVLAASARHSVVAAKRLLRAAGATSLVEHLPLEHQIFADGLVSADMAAALRARREGTLPDFEGVSP